MSPMKRYRRLEHKADLIIKGYGRSREELFFNLLMGIMENQEPEFGSEDVERQIKVKSLDEGALLVDFLNESLSLSQTYKEYYTKAQLSLKEKELKGILKGKKTERWGKEIKAATYHGLQINQEKGKWEAQVVFDV